MTRRSRVRRWRSIGAGAAGLAVVFGVAPTALADTAPSTPATSPENPDAQPAAAAKTVAPAAVTPDYGYQKYRVGVQIKSGAWVPDGTSTAGTKLRITERGPGVDGTFTTTCTTDPSTVDPGSTASFCLVPDDVSASAMRAQAKTTTPGVPTPPGVPQDELFTAQPGDTITVRQISVNDNLLLDTTTFKVPRCRAVPGTPVCENADGSGFLSTDLIFTDAAPPPVAVDDHYSTVQPNSVDISVLDNDTTHGAPASVTVDSGPSHGTLTLKAQGGAGAQPQALQLKAALTTSTGAFVYQPAAGFTGTDHFTYTLATANGTSDAVVTIVVTAPVVTTPPTTPVVEPPAPPLADTGTHSSKLIEIGLALLFWGGAATAFGRRRQTRRHAD